MTVEESPTLSKYGRLRERYLREHKRLMYYTLLTSGKLYEHLAEIDTSARDMAEYLIKEMARKQGVTEELKARDMLQRLSGKMDVSMRLIRFQNRSVVPVEKLVEPDIVIPVRWAGKSVI